MKNPLRRIATALAVLLTVSPAFSQTLSLAPANPPRWDVAGQVGWLGGNKSAVGADWNDWFDAWNGGVSLGHYLTPHLKAELRSSFAEQARVQGTELLQVPGAPYPAYQVREHRFTTSSLGAGIAYQFGTNRWFHPYAGAGADVIRERQQSEFPSFVVPGRGPVVAAQFEDRIEWRVQPAVQLGFKLYMSDRTFFRSDVRTSFSRRGAAYASWLTGIGVDL